MSGPEEFTPDFVVERHITLLPHDEADRYRSDAHRAGRKETLTLLVAGRPGAALRRMARTVENEMACLGFAGVTVPITVAMTRVIHAKRVREARQAVRS